MELVIKVVYNEDAMKFSSQWVLILSISGMAVATFAQGGVSRERAEKWLQSREFMESNPELYAKKSRISGWLTKYYTDKGTMKTESRQTVERFLATVPKTYVRKRSQVSPVLVKPSNITPKYASVRVKIETRPNVHLEKVLFKVSGAGGYAPKDRAEMVADRIDHLDNAEPSWKSNLEVATIASHGQSYVVVRVRSKSEAIVTADTRLAALAGKSPKMLAEEWIVKIQSAYGVQSTRSPDFALMELERGDDLLGDGKYEDAEKAFRGAIKFRSDLLEGYFALAQTLMKLGRKAEAQEALRDAEIYCPGQKKLILDEEKRILGGAG